jgi:DNA topoisomerase I
MEKVSNHMVEPPGIFRGRGEHPHMGKLKQRITPEMVSINIGQDNPIPRCDVPGHAWKRVTEKKDATWLAHFKDERSAFLLGKYVFLAAESSIKGENDKKKYEKARRLRASILQIRDNYSKRMVSTDLMDNQLGVCTYLIDKLALRVGNEKNEDEADTVGCCSLRVEHIRFEEDNKITLDFLGKDSMRYLNTIEVLPVVYTLL